MTRTHSLEGGEIDRLDCDWVGDGEWVCKE